MAHANRYLHAFSLDYNNNDHRNDSNPNDLHDVHDPHDPNNPHDAQIT